MSQINFRISDDEKEILQIFASQKGVTLTEYVKQNIFNTIAKDRIDLAFILLEQGKIGRKKAWFISGLNGIEFLKEWTRRNAEEVISDELAEKTLATALSLDLDLFKRHPLED